MHTPRLVKVRVNASGTRWIGYAHLNDELHRTSDVLNSSEPYLLVQDDQSQWLDSAGFRAILRDSISYVEALEEPASPDSLRLEGDSFGLKVELKLPAVRMEGELFVPTGRTPYDVLNDGRRFMSLRNVRFHSSVERYDFLAVGKRLTSVIEWTPQSRVAAS